MEGRDNNSEEYENTEEYEQEDGDDRNQNHGSRPTAAETMGRHDREHVEHDLVDSKGKARQQSHNRDQAQESAGHT